MALPTLTTQGKANLDELIHEVVESRKLPALFLTACNADEVIYENQDGFVDFDEQDGKRVDADTSELSTGYCGKALLTSCSNPSVLHDQAYDFGECTGAARL